MPEVHFDVSGIGEVDASLQQVSDRAKDMTGAWDDVIEMYIQYEGDWFDSQGDGSWPALSPSYEHWKAKHFPGEPMLVLSGGMRKTVIPPSVVDRGPDYIELGTDDPLAALHTEGAGRLPKRVVVKLTDDEKDQIYEIMRKHLMGEDDADG